MVRHDTLLVCSASRDNRKELREIFGDVFHLLEARNMAQARLLLTQNSDCIAAILLDITDIKQEDMDWISREENRKEMGIVPVIVLSDRDSPAVLNRGFSFGAADVIPMGYDGYAMLRRVETIVDLHLHKQHLETLVAEQKNLLQNNENTMVDVLSSIIEYRSLESGQHVRRIRHFTNILLEEVALCCPEYQLTQETIAIICSASALHDIGKIAIPDAILMKPGRLTEEEMEIMKTHAVTGCRILESLSDMADQEYLRYAYNICRHHHERWDGGGYPDGLRGESIPICAQVVGLVDVFDALTSKRVYKEAFSMSKAVNMIVRGECGVFSPKLLDCLKNVIGKLEAEMEICSDEEAAPGQTFEKALPKPEEGQSLDSLEWLQGKYHALVHLINGFLMELDLDRQIFHLIYNPYPELSGFEQINTTGQLQQMILNQVVHPSQRQQMEQFMSREIPRFLNEGLRRASYRFLAQGRSPKEEVLFDVTLLRINPLDQNRRTMSILICKAEEGRSLCRPDRVGAMEQEVFCCRNDRKFTLLEKEDRDLRIAGWSVPEIRQKFGGSLLEMICPEDRAAAMEEMSCQWNQSPAAELEYRVLHRDGTFHWVYSKSRICVDEEGQEVIRMILLDTNRGRHRGESLQERLQRYEIILAQTENVLFEWDIRQDTITFSDTWEKIFGYPPIDRDLHKNIREAAFIHPDDVPLLMDKISLLESGSPYEMVEIRIATSWGRYLWCRFRASVIRDARGVMQKVCGIILNIDAEKQAEQALQTRAEQDSLTKLLNKNAARRQAEEYLSRYSEGVDCGLLIIDLDDFKSINDQYGHLFGDAVLTQVARDIRKLFRGQDIVARIGGDEFMVLMRGVSDEQILNQRCSRLIRMFCESFRSSGNPITVSCSIGIAVAPKHGKTYVELFQHADQALYRAKARGKNCCVMYNQEDADLQTYPGRTTMVSNPIDSDREPGLANDNFVRYAFQKLYSSQDVEKSVNELLGYVGRKMNVSRVYVFENSEDDRFCSNTYEWCNEGIPPEIQNLQNISYETDLSGYEDNFDEQGIFYCPDVNILPPAVYDIVAPQGIKSMLHCAIRENGRFRGYIGFDECREWRMWTKEQISLLTYFSEALSMFLLRERRQEKVRQQADELQSILDNQNAWIYIIDPETFRLRYINARLKEEKLDICPGMLCYQALRGRDAVCPQCPAVRMAGDTTAQDIRFDGCFHCHILMESTRIRWEGQEACLLSGRKLQGLDVAAGSETKTEIPV